MTSKRMPELGVSVRIRKEEGEGSRLVVDAQDRPLKRHGDAVEVALHPVFPTPISLLSSPAVGSSTHPAATPLI